MAIEKVEATVRVDSASSIMITITILLNLGCNHSNRSFEFDGRSVNDCFQYLVGVVQALVDRYVPISSQTHVPV